MLWPWRYSVRRIVRSASRASSRLTNSCTSTCWGFSLVPSRVCCGCVNLTPTEWIPQHRCRSFRLKLLLVPFLPAPRHYFPGKQLHRVLDCVMVDQPPLVEVADKFVHVEFVL